MTGKSRKQTLSYYILLHKNIPVLKFSLHCSKLFHVEEIYNSEHIPIGLFDKKTKTVKDFSFASWWHSRTIPSCRPNLEEVFTLLNLNSKEELLDKTYSLSVTDHYWIKNENDNIAWEDVNFFDNGFNSSIGDFLLYQNQAKFTQQSFNTPDLFTEGVLPKKWISKDDGIYLIKGTNSTFQQEPFNEAVAAYICKKLNINHVKYNISFGINEEGEKEYFSVCKNFVTKECELVTASDIYYVKRKLRKETSYQHLVKCCKSLGIKKFETEFHKIFILDFIMANTDRHLRNFGFLRNPDTLEWLGIAPIFDTERSLLLNKLNPTSSQIRYSSNPFNENQFEQLDLLVNDKKLKLDFSKLNDLSTWFDNLLRKNSYISEKRREELVTLLDSQIQFLNQMILERKRELDIK